jgi:hypothetical protein
MLRVRPALKRTSRGLRMQERMAAEEDGFPDS